MEQNKLSALIHEISEVRQRVLKRKMHTCVQDKELFYKARSTPEILHTRNPDKEDLSLIKELHKQIIQEIKKP